MEWWDWMPWSSFLDIIWQKLKCIMTCLGRALQRNGIIFSISSSLLLPYYGCDGWRAGSHLKLKGRFMCWEFWGKMKKTWVWSIMMRQSSPAFTGSELFVRQKKSCCVHATINLGMNAGTKTWILFLHFIFCYKSALKVDLFSRILLSLVVFSCSGSSLFYKSPNICKY